MPVAGKTRIRGARALDKALRDLPGAMGQNVLRGAVREGANVIKDAAHSNLGEKGALVVKNRRGKKGLALVSIALRPDKWALKFKEMGAAPHTITPKKASVLADGEGAIFGSVIHHPGVAARPWFRPAFDSNINTVIAHIGQALGRRIQQAARKVTRGQVNARTGRKIR